MQKCGVVFQFHSLLHLHEQNQTLYAMLDAYKQNISNIIWNIKIKTYQIPTTYIYNLYYIG